MREVTHGAPAKLFKLDCPPCEAYLAKTNADLWAQTLSELPETYDEVKSREDFEKRGALDRDQVMALAMAKLAGVELPDSMRRPISGLAPHVPSIAGVLECVNGHGCEPGSKFCDECGTELRPQGPAACPDGHRNKPGAKFCRECRTPLSAAPAALEAPPAPAPAPAGPKRRLRDMRAEELRTIARGKGLDDSGSRTEVLARLQAA
jgi:hypothetical protein